MTPISDSSGITQQPGIIGVIPIILIFLIFYFLVIRPQANRIREIEKKRETLQKGDRIVTGGGIFGTVNKIEDQVVHVTISPQVHIEVLRTTIMDVLKNK